MTIQKSSYVHYLGMNLYFAKYVHIHVRSGESLSKAMEKQDKFILYHLHKKNAVVLLSHSSFHEIEQWT